MNNCIIRKPFYYLRHGQTDENIKNIVLGLTNAPLNNKGKEQAHKSAVNLKGQNINSIATSPLKRAQETAEIISRSINKVFIIIFELREIDFGILQNKPIINKLNPILESIAKKNFSTKYKTESLNQVKQRVAVGINKALKLNNQPVLIVCHKAIYHVLCILLELDYNSIKNCQCIYHKPLDTPSTKWKAITI